MKTKRILYSFVFIVLVILMTSSVSALQLDWPVWGTKFSQDDAILVKNTDVCFSDCELTISVTQKQKDYILGKGQNEIDYKIKQLRNNPGTTNSVIWEKRNVTEKTPITKDVTYEYDCGYKLDWTEDGYFECYEEVYNKKNKTTTKTTHFFKDAVVINDVSKSGVIQYVEKEIIDYNIVEYTEWVGSAPGVKNLRIFVNGERFNGNFDDSKETKKWDRTETFEIKVTGQLTRRDDAVDIIPSMLGLDITKFAVWETIPATDLQSGNVAYYAFDETGQNYSIDVYGVTGVAGKINGAYKFDGTGDYADAGNVFNPSIGDKYTYCMWVKPDVGDDKDEYLSAKYKIDLGVWNSQLVIAYYPGSAPDELYKVDEDINDGVWNHLCYVYEYGNGSTADIYINGSLGSNGAWMSGDGTRAPPSNANTLKIATNDGYIWGGDAFQGTIDDVRVINRLLNSSQISAIYNSGNGIESSVDNETFHWTLNSLNDSSGNDYFIKSHDGSTNTEGEINEAFEFDGTDYLNAGDWIDEFWNNGGTIGFWLNITDMTDTGYIISKKSSGTNDGWYWVLNPTEFSFHQDFSTTDGKWDLSLANFTENKWSYVTIVYNASSVANDPIIYVNGVDAGAVETQTPVGTARYTSTTDFTIGDRMAGDAGVKAVIDEIGAWSRILNESEILWLNASRNPWTYVEPSPPSSTPIVAITTPEWITTGGFTSGPRIYGQIIDNVTVSTTVTNANGSILYVNITVTSPNGIVINNVAMTNYSGNSTNATFNYSTDFVLNVAGNWTINTTAFYGNVTNSSTTIIEVPASNFTVSTNHYGFTTGGIPSESQIANYISDYTYDLVEITNNITTMNSNWATTLSRFNTSYTANLVGGYNIILDCNCSDDTDVQTYKTQITNNFPDLLTGVYQSAIIYLSLEFVNNSYNVTEIDNCFNNISKAVVDATSNQFIVYAKGYNSSGLDTGYISPTTMLYNNQTFPHLFINWEAETSRTNSYLNRIYDVNLQSATLLDIGEDLQNKAYKVLRAGINSSTTVVGTNIAELLNEDILVFNNLSLNIDNSITIKSGVGKDVYDHTNKDIITTDMNLTFNVSVSNYSVSYIMLDDFDHYQMTSLTKGTLYKATVSGWNNFSWDDDSREAANQVTSSTRRLLYLFDPESITDDVYQVYYGWLNASYIQNWSMYEFVIIADKNGPEIDLIVNQTDILGYVGVFDYDESNATWVDGKKAQIDEWFALNSDMAGIFLDGLDSATITNATDFEIKFKEIIDYVRITKGKLAYLNTYTYNEAYCTWGDACMKESCVRRWNGANASNPDSYTWEDWDLELEKSSFYNSHNVKVICQGFDNRTNSVPYQVYNYSRMLDAYYASKVLGYEFWSWKQPDFQYAQDIYVPDIGTDMSNSWSTDDNETYYRLYSNGVIYYNTSSHHGWQDDGKTFTNVTLYANLHDDATPQIYHMLINDGLGVQYDYTVTTAGGGWAYNTYEIPLNISTQFSTGRYKIEVYGTTGIAYLGIDSSGTTTQGTRSWYSTNSGATWGNEVENLFYMFTLGINSSRQSSLASDIELVTQTETSYSLWENVSLLSVHDYTLDTWSNPTDRRLRTFDNFSFWNGTTWYNLYPLNTTTCDTDNPSWNTTSIDGSDYKSCYEYDGFDYLFRVMFPHMSQQDVGIFGEPPQYANELYVSPSTPHYTQNLNCNFNVTTVDNSTELNISITWYNSTDNSTWSQVNTYNTTYNNVTLNALYTTTAGNGSVIEILNNYSYWKCEIEINDGFSVLDVSSAPVAVFPLENLTLYSDDNLTERADALNATFSVIDYDNGINCFLDINESEIHYNYSLEDEPTILCYQESANVSTSCGGKSTGSYKAGAGFFYINYTKPDLLYNAIWQVKHGGGLYNITLPDSCLDYNDELIQVAIYSYFVGGVLLTTYSSPWCYNGAWIMIGTNYTTVHGEGTDVGSEANMYDGIWNTYAQSLGGGTSWYNGTGDTTEGAKIYEEAMWWNIYNYTDNKTNAWVFQNKSNNIGYRYYDSGAGGYWWYNFTNRESNYLSWNINHTNGTGTYLEVDIPLRCHNDSVVQIRDVWDAFGDKTVQCYNTTAWETLWNIEAADNYTTYGLNWYNYNASILNGTNTTLLYAPSVDGAYNWNISCMSTSSIEPLISESRIFRYDTTGPTFSNYEDSSTSIFPEIGDSIVLNVTISDMFTIDKCQLQINDNGSWWNSTSYNGIATEGEYNLTMGWTVRSVSTANNSNVSWRVECADLAGNWNTSDNNTFTVKDVTKPTITLNANNSFDMSNTSIISSALYNLSLSVTFWDYNMFQAEINISCDINGSLYNWNVLDYNGTNLTHNAVVALTGWEPQKCTFNMSGSDDHTAKEIPNYKVTTINNGLNFETENNNIIDIKLKTKDKKEKPFIGHTDVKKVKTKKQLDRYNFEFEFNEPSITRTFTLNTNNKLYPREQSAYPGHFVVWNEETNTGNWIDFADIDDINDVKIKKINDYEYEVTIKSNNAKDKLEFNSIGGTNVFNLSGYFYIGGAVNLSGNNIYDDSIITNWIVNVTTLNSYPGWDGVGSINTTQTWDWLENVSNGTYQLDFTHSCFLPQTKILNVTNITQALIWNSSQASYFVRVRNIATGVYLSGWNISLYNYDTGVWSNKTNVDAAGTTFYLNATTYNMTIVVADYDDYNINLTLDCLEEKVESIDMSFLSQFYLYDEATLDVFNISGTDSVRFLLFCPDATYTTLINTTSPIIPITCDYTKFKFVIDYTTNAGETYYRTFILEPDDAFEVDIYLIDMITTDWIYNSFIVDDLLEDYDNPSIYITKIINDETPQITANFVDVEDKIGAYLIENHEYIISLHSDNLPVRVFGAYSADIGGEKTLRLYDIEIDPVGIGFINNVQYYAGINNRSGAGNVTEYFAVAGYYDIENITNSVTWTLYADTYNGTTIYETIQTGQSIEFEYNITTIYNENRTIYSRMHINRSSHDFVKILREFTEIQLDIMDYLSTDFVNWFFIILLGTLAIMGTIKTANMLSIILIGMATLFVLFGWFGISGGILALAAIVTLFSILKKGDKNMSRE